MRYAQGKFGAKQIFDFGDEKLIYTAKEGSVTHSFTLAYEAIDINEKDFLELKLPFVQTLGWMFFIFAFVALGYGQAEHKQLQIEQLLIVLAYLGLSVCFFLCAHFKKNKYTRILTPYGRLVVRQDKHHDTILNLIVEKRRDRIRTLYAIVDLETDPEQEIGKFDYLHTQGIITQEEHAQAVDKIRRHHGLPAKNPDTEKKSILH